MVSLGWFPFRPFTMLDLSYGYGFWNVGFWNLGLLDFGMLDFGMLDFGSQQKNGKNGKGLQWYPGQRSTMVAVPFQTLGQSSLQGLPYQTLSSCGYKLQVGIPPTEEENHRLKIAFGGDMLVPGG